MTPQEKKFRRDQRADALLAVVILVCLLVMIVGSLGVLLMWITG